MVLLMFFQAVYFGHFLSFYTMLLEPPKSNLTGAVSTALTLSVPCRPMPMVSSVDQVAAYQVCSHPASVCLVDHMLHGDCADVMTLGSQRRTVAYYTWGE